MTKQEFAKLAAEGVLLLDGATGTNLMEAGMPVGVCPELWVMEHPQVLMDLQNSYVEAGSRIVYAPTFTGNRIKLAEYGLADRLEEINRTLVHLSKEAVRGRAFVAADMTMTGRQLFPIGELMFEELVSVYREQARVLADAGADLFVVETMMSLQECRAAVLAVREVCGLPVMVTLTYNEDGRTLFGTPPETAVVVLQSLGVDAVGMNCSTGPTEMLGAVRKMAEYATVPIIAKPNAGMPELAAFADAGEQLLSDEHSSCEESGSAGKPRKMKTVYRMTPEEFAEAGARLVEAGASIVGGCCGTTGAHIQALAGAVAGMPVRKPLAAHRRVLTSERRNVEIELDGNFLVVGERINPTGKKRLQEELRAGKLDLVCDMAQEQADNGASILDVNMGMNGIDEKAMMERAVYELSSTVDCPLCIDTSRPDVMEAALRIYPGRALVNSVSLEEEKIKKMLPVVKKYGAMFVLLPLSDAGLPKDAQEKQIILEKVYGHAMELGISHEDIVVDGLVATIGANPNAARECFETIAYCKKVRSLPTICGLSNISFGMPERGCVNTAFLTMAIGRGLTMAIANPSQELLMNAAFASDMLLNRPDSGICYIERMNRLSEVRERQAQTVPTCMPPQNQPEKPGVKRAEPVPACMPPQSQAAQQSGRQGAERPRRAQFSSADTGGVSPGGRKPNGEGADDRLYGAVLKSSKGTIVDEVKKALDAGEKPEEIINGHLIPAINEVGALFERGKYFLPQLIGSANTMKLAIDYLEPLLERSASDADMPKIVVATVEGDIHDIGKNLVVLMLKNHGYRVIDLGKDVPCEKIVDTAIQEQAAVIGLSALMTTTMMRMQEVVLMCRERGCTSRVIIGGACITQSFADEIGADGYSKDAAECVKLVEKLLAKHGGNESDDSK